MSRTDKKFMKLGFKKVHENKYGASFIRKDEHGFYHKIEIGHKASNKHLIHSYQSEINHDGFNNSVGMTVIQAKLALKKYKELKRKYGWVGAPNA